MLTRTARASNVLAYALIAPAVLFLCVFFIYPLVQTLALSFASNDGGVFENYRRMATDLNFSIALQNTFWVVVVSVPAQLVLALAMSQMLQYLQTGRGLILWVWTIPLGISDLAAGLAWLAVMQNNGYFNSLLYKLGLAHGQLSWLNSETPLSLFLVIVVAEIWRATAIVLIILVAGLQTIPKEYGEAASVFGAGTWRIFRYVTLPLMKSSIQSALILRTVLAFEVFAVVYALGGTSFPILAGEAYNWQYVNQNSSVAAAYAVVIMVISILATLFYLAILRTDKAQLP